MPANTSVYTATKAAVDAITGTLAKELAKRKIRVNAMNPGMIETEGVHSAGFAESDSGNGLKRRARLDASDRPRIFHQQRCIWHLRIPST
jgi:3-oxoacyl-[acyl-carrier protein] reductase